MRRGPRGSESASFDAGSGSATLLVHVLGGENHVPPHAQAELALGRRATRAPTLSEMELVAAEPVCMRAVAAIRGKQIHSYPFFILRTAEVRTCCPRGARQGSQKSLLGGPAAY
jgi:hypothetical protein